MSDPLLPPTLCGGSAAGELACAVVVTYNRPALLRACLLAIQAQARAVDTLLVVDNASTDGTRAMLRAEFPGATVLALAANGGGAGGFHAGMKWAYAQGYDWLWVMDDDARPAPDCLARLLAQARPDRVLVPIQQATAEGGLYGISAWRHAADVDIEVTAEVVAQGRSVSGDFVFRFVGPLIAREVVAQIGLPNKDFFIWWDDIEYALRIQRRTQLEIVAVPDARIFHLADFKGESREAFFLGRRSLRNPPPIWKTYYGARNHCYLVIRTRRDPRDILWYLLVHLKLLLGELAFEPDRWERAKMHLLGIFDGALGRLGKRV